MDTLEYLIILELLNNPTITITDLALKLNSTRPTVSKYLKNLKERGIIRNSIANVYPQKLGLSIVDVIVFVKSFKDLLKLEKACDEHPYTYYRSRIYGKNFGLFIIFYTPSGTTENIIQFFNELKFKEIIKEYQIYEGNGVSANSDSDISKFDIENNRWDFSWEDWINSIDKEKTEMKKNNIETVDLNNIKESHFKILRILTQNAAVKQNVIAKELNLSKTEAHRQYNFVIEELVKEIVQLFNRDNFFLNETFLTIVHDVTKEEQARIINKMRTEPPPFYSNLSILKGNKFRFWINTSIDQAGIFISSMFKRYANLEIYTLITRQKGSALYYFYPENFDFQKKKWKTSKEYMIEEPLKKI